MEWCAAHIIMYVRFLDGIQDKYIVWENVLLLSAENEQTLSAKAEQLGRTAYEGEVDEVTSEGRPAVWEFVGVRKIISCAYPIDLESAEMAIHESEADLKEGTELTFSKIQVASYQALMDLAAGKSVTVHYEYERHP